MQNQSIIIPNYPPPPLPPFFSRPMGCESENRLNLFKQRLANYKIQKNMSGVGQSNDRNLIKSSNTIKLSEVKNELRGALQAIDDLKIQRNHLKEQISTLSENEWYEKITDILNKKRDLENLIANYKSPNFQSNIQEKTSKRCVKRARIKKRKEITRQCKQKALEDRQRKNAKVDAWYNRKIAENAKERKKIDDIKRAEQILSGVTKKKSEAKRYISLFDSLIELRGVRRIQSGKHDTGEQDFVAKINRLKNIWIDAVHNYEIEEKELRIFFGDITDVSTYDDWFETLFGTTKIVDRENPVLKGEYNLKEFLKNRKSWDQCIVPNDHPFGSSIPIGWVLPKSNPSEKWTAYRTKKLISGVDAKEKSDTDIKL